MADPPTTQEYRYWAFITYSHKDEAQAKWLHRAIETYGIPAKLVEHEHAMPTGEPAPKRFQPIFRDRDELPASADLGQAIEDALRASRYLIVVCSPHAAQSRWVNREIETFTELGRSDRVLAFIVDGEPNSGDERECFPPALRQVEPLAADARPQGDGRADAKLKLLAGMLGVGFDALKRRDDQRRIRRLQLTVAVVLFLAAVLAGVAVYVNQQRAQAVRARQRAVASEATAVVEAHMRSTAEAQAQERRGIAEAAQATAVAEARVRATAQAQAQAAGATAIAAADARATAQAHAEAAATQEAVARKDAERQARRARAGELTIYARDAIAGDKNDPSLALLLAHQAVETTWKEDGYVLVNADSALRDAIDAAPPYRMTLPRYRHGGTVQSAAVTTKQCLFQTKR
jgi:hypothetical protein